jgi:hypothetical protein
MVYKVEGATPDRLAFWGEYWPKRPKARCYTCGRVCRGPTAWVGAPCVRAAPTDTPCVGGSVPTKTPLNSNDKFSGFMETNSGRSMHTKQLH